MCSDAGDTPRRGDSNGGAGVTVVGGKRKNLSRKYFPIPYAGEHEKQSIFFLSWAFRADTILPVT